MAQPFTPSVEKRKAARRNTSINHPEMGKRINIYFFFLRWIVIDSKCFVCFILFAKHFFGRNLVVKDANGSKTGWKKGKELGGRPPTVRARLSNALHLVGFFFVSWLQQPLGAIRLEIVHLMCPSTSIREREKRVEESTWWHVKIGAGVIYSRTLARGHPKKIIIKRGEGTRWNPTPRRSPPLLDWSRFYKFTALFLIAASSPLQ